MNSRLLKRNPESGLETWWHYCPYEDKAVVEHKQDCSGILDINTFQSNDPDYSRNGIKKDWWHVARIPSVVAIKWMREYGVNIFDPSHTERAKKLVLDPEWQKLKVTRGRF